MPDHPLRQPELPAAQLQVFDDRLGDRPPVLLGEEPPKPLNWRNSMDYLKFGVEETGIHLGAFLICSTRLGWRGQNHPLGSHPVPTPADSESLGWTTPAAAPNCSWHSL